MYVCIYRLGAVPWCWEYKVYSPYITTPNYGSGRADTGGRASTADGYFIAFGGTEEALNRTVGGVKGKGVPADYLSDGSQRLDGRGGYVMAHDGDYADALNKGYGLTILVAESTGAISATFAALLRRYARLASEPGVTDYTAYGESSSSPRDFYGHHLAAYSAAIILADVDTILNGAASMSFLATRWPN